MPRGLSYVDKGGAVERSKDHVHLPVDIPQERRNAERQGAVPGPVRGGRERDGFGADLCWENLRGVRPRGGTPRGGKAGDEQVSTGDDGLGHALVIGWNAP